MFISQEKLKSNIAEYILYMWHVEDVVRACAFDLNKIEENIIQQLGISDVQQIQLRNWYKGIVDEMKRAKLLQRGHLQEVEEKMAELHLLHTTLLTVLKDKEYIALFDHAKPEIEELKKKSEVKVDDNLSAEKKSRIVKNDIEACFNGLYGLWMLRLQKKEISAETSAALNKISKLISYLTRNYHTMMTGL